MKEKKLDWLKTLEEILSRAKTSDKGWNASGWQQLDSHSGKNGACSLWVDTAHPTRYAIKSGYFGDDMDTSSLGCKPDFLCCGKEHALEIYARTRRSMDEEVASA